MSSAMGPNGLSSPVIAADGTIYITTIEFDEGKYRNKLYGVNRDGTKKLEQEFASEFSIRTPEAPMGLAPVIGDDRIIYVGGMDGKMRAVSPGNARTIWEFAAYTGTPSLAAISVPVLNANGMLYFGTGDGKVFALKASTGSANSPWPMYGGDLRRSGSVGKYGTNAVIRSLNHQSDGTTALTLIGQAGKTYTLQASTDFVNWTKVQEVTTANGAALFHDSSAGSASHRFYRAASP